MVTTRVWLFIILGSLLLLLLLWRGWIHTDTFRTDSISAELREGNMRLGAIEKILLNKQDRINLKDEARKKVVRANIRPDDPELVSYVARHEIHPPALQKVYKIAVHPVIKTAQAESIDKLFNGKRGLYFADCGAYDGEQASNTFWLEKERGWHGVLIEVDPSFFMQIQGKNRKSHSLNICLSVKPYPMKMEFTESTGQLGALIQNGKQHHGVSTYCFSFLTVMLALNVTKVDFFSLDVEGAELDVLKTIPFDKIDITALSVEYAHVPGGENALMEFMKGAGYSLHQKIDKHNPRLNYFARDLIFVKKGFKP